MTAALVGPAAMGTEPVELWSLRDDVAISATGDRSRRLIRTSAQVQLDDLSDGVREALTRMAMGPVRLGNIRTDADELRAVLVSASHLFVCSMGATDAGGPLLSLVTSSPSMTMERRAVGGRVRLSRFACLRLVPGRGLQLESSRSRLRVQLQRPEAGAIVGTLGRAVDVPTIARQAGVPGAIALGVVEYLLGAGVVVVESAGGVFEEDGEVERGSTLPTSDRDDPL